MSMPAKTKTYLADASLVEIWQKIRKRLESNGHRPVGTVTVELDSAAARRLSGLPGIAVRAGQRRLKLAELDDALRRSAAKAGLVPVVADLTGGPLRDRPSERLERAEAVRQLWDGVERSLHANGFGTADWARSWISWLHQSTLLVRGGDAAFAEFEVAARALAIVLAEPGTSRMLGELANTVGGSSHALDADQLAGRIALRGLGFALGVEDPQTPRGRIELWEQVGVSVDRVSGTVLIWAFRPPGRDEWSRMMQMRADLGLISHMTMAELAVAPGALVPTREIVSGCENPQVLQRIAESGIDRPVACFSGSPSSAGQLLAARVALRYHGDFDWAGVAIAARMIAAGAEPWRMGSRDYLEAVSAGIPRIPLTGRSVATPWDPDLQAAMERAEQAVHEESVLNSLISDL
ncbi:TIGR02679 domain-containing protein [Nocardia asteroides]|uniref:TIGR02679 domain-containing protein n=1 Tax=Nocardia asteroides TaxID=1824 RepID=UPI001E2E3DEC|nr:TIGR02679 domain-containing protein [Nocardia asteroides]UGT54413.1 TIGR02679 domain-containing protein [Nocardia asteroides]